MGDTRICPSCGERVMPDVVGKTNEEGEWEYDFTECPICGHIFRS